MRISITKFGGWGLVLALLASCSPEKKPSDSEESQDPTGSAGSSSASGTGGSFGFGGGLNGSGGGRPTCTPGGPNDDVDRDGFTPAEGDCDDCDPNSNPNAIEVIATDNSPPKDEDCDGKVDDVDNSFCDQDLVVSDMDPMNAAHAVDLCRRSTDAKHWGVVEAQWVLSDGSPPPTEQRSLAAFHLGHGLLPGFGPNVKTQKGKRLLALSSGTARQPTDPGYLDPAPSWQDISSQGFDKGYASKSPQGYPKESPACPDVKTGDPHDAAGLEVAIRIPSNVHGFSFDFDFYTSEWPVNICSSANDFFLALLSPIPSGQKDGNISFDIAGNPVSVNNAFIDVCGCEGNPPNVCLAGGKMYPCSLGDSELIGTGFGSDTVLRAPHLVIEFGATGWLNTKAPVEPSSEIRLRWVVYDSGDGLFDSSTLIDNWQWLASPGITVGTTRIPH